MKQPYKRIDQAFDRFNELYGESTEAQKKRYCSAFDKFKKLYDKDCAFVASSSGRVEVCGNHTDHNGGKVISSAISLDTLAMFLPTDDDVIKIVSDGYPEIVVNLNSKNEIKKGTSAALVKGVVEGLKNRNYKVGGFVATFTSNVLGGAGISSSASFEVLVAEILNFLYNDSKIDCQTKALVSQYAENEYFGKPCGLLDQTAIAYGGLKKLDFKDKNQIYVSDVKCKFNDYSFVLINTGGSHEDLTDEYASIPREMKQVASVFGEERLIDVGKEKFLLGISDACSNVSDRAILRAYHFFEENDRVDEASCALESDNYKRFIEIINESGISSNCYLQNCYVAGSCDQAIPRTVAICKSFLNGGAARVHGGGFAGSVLNIVKNENLDSFTLALKKIYGEENVIILKMRSVGTIVL